MARHGSEVLCDTCWRNVDRIVVCGVGLMGLFRLEVASRKTGHERVMVREAESSEEAVRKANKNGWLVARIEEYVPDPLPPVSVDSDPREIRTFVGEAMRCLRAGENLRAGFECLPRVHTATSPMRQVAAIAGAAWHFDQARIGADQDADEILRIRTIELVQAVFQRFGPTLFARLTDVEADCKTMMLLARTPEERRETLRRIGAELGEMGMYSTVLVFEAAEKWCDLNDWWSGEYRRANA